MTNVLPSEEVKLQRTGGIIASLHSLRQVLAGILVLERCAIGLDLLCLRLLNHEPSEESVHGLIIVPLTDPAHILVRSKDDTATLRRIDAIVLVGLAIAFMIALSLR